MFKLVVYSLLCYEHHRVMSIYDENKNFTLVIYRLYVSRGCGLVEHVLAHYLSVMIPHFLE